MTKFLQLFCLTIILFSCNKKGNITYYWVSFHGHDYKKADTTQIINFDKSENRDTTKLNYITKYSNHNYFIIKDKDSSFIISNLKDSLNHPNDSAVLIRSFYDTSLVFNKETFKIKEFILDEFVTDGSSIHYYTPSLGIYAIHSATWPGIKYLQTNDTTINRQINYLIKITVPKFFIRDTLEQIFK